MNYEDGHPTLMRREYDVHCAAQTILEDPANWGINDPDQCVAMAEQLLNLRWLLASGRMSEWDR